MFAELPTSFRTRALSAERMASGRSVPKQGCFLEGPAFDRYGNLYVTDMPFGRIFHIDARGCFTLVAEYDSEPNGALDRLADNLPSPNGLALNGAQDILYVAVTRANAVWRLPLLAPTPRNPAGGVASMGMFIQLSGGRGPDGMAIDAEDGLAVAHPDMGAVWLFDRRGEPVLRIDLPKSAVVTNVAHGGPDLRTLYIVDSEAGCILSAPVPADLRFLRDTLGFLRGVHERRGPVTRIFVVC